MFSPHTRGCSGELTELLENDVVFPAYAGMFRFTDVVDACVAGFPRIRGDVPLIPAMTEALTAFSPHTRGCSADRQLLRENNEVFPAYAGMFRRPGHCGYRSYRFSPHTRGCSLPHHPRPPYSHVFPAYAGMFRWQSLGKPPKGCFPRIRGDVPAATFFTALRSTFSPHTRGCSVEYELKGT